MSQSIHQRWAVRLSLAAITVAVLGVGCVSPERKPAVKAVASLADTRGELLAGRENLDEVSNAIVDLQSRPASLTPAYERYKDAVVNVERRARAVRERVQDMRMRSAEYRTSWSQENSEISDPGVRATAEERRQSVINKYSAIDSDAQELRAAYDPYITKLHDLQTVLANDLTYPGVNAAKPTLDEVRGDTADLRAEVDALINKIDDASMRLRPSSQPMK